MTDEYIPREAAMIAVGKAYVQGNDTETQYKECVYQINRIPAADVRPVVRGKWIDTCVRDWTCSVCKGKIDKVRHVDGYYYKDLPNFCPDCGARMEQ